MNTKIAKTATQEALEEAKDSVTNAQRKVRRLKEFLKLNLTEINRVEKALTVVAEWLIRISIDPNTASFDLSYAGDKHVLQGIFSALRKAGYAPDDRPAENLAAFSTYWNKPGSPGMRIYLNFASTVCKRVKTGTKMVETPVYETVCG